MPDDTAEEILDEAVDVEDEVVSDSDSGPTPADEESTGDEAGRHTPDSDPTDADGSDEDTTPEEKAEEQLEEEEESEDAATDQDQDSEDSGEEEEEEDEFYFQGEHSDYQTEEELREGVNKKDELLNRYRSELEEARREAEQAKAQVQSLREAMPQDQQKEMVVQQYMREELDDGDEDLLSMSEEEIESDRDKRIKLEKARAKAEARYENELDKAKEQQKQQLQQRRERLDEADNFVTSWVTPDKFSANTSEDRIELRNYFEEVPEGEEVNRAEKAVLLYADYGEDAAENYLEGIRSRFLGDQQEKVEETIDKSTPEPKPEPTPSSESRSETEEETGYNPESPFEALRDGINAANQE